LELTQPTGKTETIVSAVVLTLLAAVGAFILYRQFQFNPAVVAATAPDRATAALGGSAGERSTAAIVALPDSVIPLSPAESFAPSSLSDKIDGKAELYLSAGFQRLESQRFRIRNADGAWMELFLYDMGNPENAFAVYSSQQRADGVPTDISRFSYRTENALYWVHGPYYAELIASDSSEPVRQAMQSIARSMVSGQPAETPAVDLPSIFPAQHRRADGVTLIPSDAFGFSKLDRVYTAEYKLDQGAFTAFLSDRGSAENAAAAAKAYRSFLLEFGGRRLESPAADAAASELTVVEILGSYEVIFARGRFLAGVHEAPEIPPALALAKSLRSQIDEFTRSQSR